MVTLAINGQRVEVEEGTTVLKAAEQMGIRIPTLCYHELVEPYAACRVCMVELPGEGGGKLATACNTRVEQGMEVLTDSERALRARRMNVELLLASCPNVKVIRELADELGIEKPRFPLRDEDCIRCGLCVRVCSEVAGAHAISFADRGIEREVTTPYHLSTDACIACGACAYVCPTECIKMETPDGRRVLHEQLALGPKTPIHIPFMQAVPNVPSIDRESCIHFKTGECRVCERVCEPEAVVHDMEEEIVELEVGNIVLATGFQLMDPKAIFQYGYGRLPNVVTSLEFEHMNAAAGATGGEILLADGREPSSIALLHCIGSRDDRYHSYCSRVCCMYALKYAHLIREKLPEADIYQLYIDMRCFGKGYEEFYGRLLEEGVKFIRGKCAEISDFPIYEEERGKLILRCEDTLVGAVRRIPVDMVVLCPAIEATADAEEVARLFSVSRGKDGFFMERHPKLEPMLTAADGVYLAGCCQGPKDIPDSVAQGLGAAAQVLSVIDRGVLELDAATSMVDADVCSGCKVCNTLCAFNAISFNEEEKVSEINEAICKGCGACAAACPSGAIRAKHFTDKQIYAEIEGVLGS